MARPPEFDRDQAVERAMTLFWRTACCKSRRVRFHFAIVGFNLMRVLPPGPVTAKSPVIHNANLLRGKHVDAKQ